MTVARHGGGVGDWREQRGERARERHDERDAETGDDHPNGQRRRRGRKRSSLGPAVYPSWARRCRSEHARATEVARAARHMISSASYTSTVPPPSSTGAPFALSVASSRLAAVMIE